MHPTVDSPIAAVGISLLAYKGFTTITTTGDEIENPNRNVGRAIIKSIAVDGSHEHSDEMETASR